jgi:hypothetical protein
MAMAAVLHLRHVASALCSLAWKVSVPVIGAGVLIGIFLKDSNDPTIGVKQPGRGQAVFSDQEANVLVTLGDAGTRGFSTCVMQDREGTEIARVDSLPNGRINFAFGGTSPVRGSGTLYQNGAVDLGIGRGEKHQYIVSVQPDGSSVVQVVVGDDRGEKVRTVRLSPSGDVLSEEP